MHLWLMIMVIVMIIIIILFFMITFIFIRRNITSSSSSSSSSSLSAAASPSSGAPFLGLLRQNLVSKCFPRQGMKPRQFMHPLRQRWCQKCSLPQSINAFHGLNNFGFMAGLFTLTDVVDCCWTRLNVQYQRFCLKPMLTSYQVTFKQEERSKVVNAITCLKSKYLKMLI